MNSYLIDYSDWFDEGGSCQFYPIKNEKNLGFKEFGSKQKAVYAYKIQRKLSRYDLAPKLFTTITKLGFAKDCNGWTPEVSDWGFVTEIAKPVKFSTKNDKLRLIQRLVEDIFEKTKLKFWDCHFDNIGLVKRKNRNKLVCIDTGKESFSGLSNAWGFSDPGPKCSYCEKYQCRCSEY